MPPGTAAGRSTSASKRSSSARAIVGTTTSAVTDVDDEGNATASYALDGLDVALAAGNGEPGPTDPPTP